MPTPIFGERTYPHWSNGNPNAGFRSIYYFLPGRYQHRVSIRSDNQFEAIRIGSPPGGTAPYKDTILGRAATPAAAMALAMADFQTNPPPGFTPLPAPVLGSLTPNTIAHGGTGFLLTVNGTGFVDGSFIAFGTAIGQATFVSATQLTMQVAAAGYAAAGTVQVSVQAPGAPASNQLPFTIT